MNTIKIPSTINVANAIYLPDLVRKALNIKSGDKLSMEVIDGALIIKPYFDPVDWSRNYLLAHNLDTPVFYKTGRDRGAGITTVILVNGNVGVAQCSPNDKFDSFIGEAIALARALGEDNKIPEEIFR